MSSDKVRSTRIDVALLYIARVVRGTPKADISFPSSLTHRSYSLRERKQGL